MAKKDVEMKEEPKQNDSAESEEPQAEVSKEEKERLVLEGKLKCMVSGRFARTRYAPRLSRINKTSKNCVQYILSL